MLNIKHREENPSRRFFCLDKDRLDNLLNNIETIRDENRKSKLDLNLHFLTEALATYIEQRKKVGCEGCKKGEYFCVHWSPEKDETF